MNSFNPSIMTDYEVLVALREYGAATFGTPERRRERLRRFVSLESNQVADRGFKIYVNRLRRIELAEELRKAEIQRRLEVRARYEEYRRARASSTGTLIAE